MSKLEVIGKAKVAKIVKKAKIAIRKVAKVSKSKRHGSVHVKAHSRRKPKR